MNKKQHQKVEQNIVKTTLKKCIRYLLSIICGLGGYFCVRYLIKILLSKSHIRFDIIGWYRPFATASEDFLLFELLPIILGSIIFMTLAPKQTKTDKIICWVLVISALVLRFYFVYESHAFPLGKLW